VNVLVLGGGPGGLYAALLLKKGHPQWRIRVLERNPAGATYGWGIVFSDRTLASFREADLPTYQDIVRRFVLWDTIEVRRGAEVIRCGGNVFSGMSRKILLEILARRCVELGVEVAFATDVQDLSILDGLDLVVAADGANSLVRKAHASVFRPTIQWGKSKYAWFGTTQVFDAFTFIFRESEHGPFQAHVYPHVGTASTMVIECAEETWRAAGLECASEVDSVERCEAVFAEDLCGHALLANKSDWQSFPTVRNRTWRCGGVVLLGDAAHTAHFGIGSGTKLAMEDAIALASAFERHSEDVERAASEYELERRPIVEAFQEAALESGEYFENTRRYAGFDVLPFAFHLLTRNSRITYDELRRRDSAFIDAVDRSFFRHAHRNGDGSPLFAPPPAFAPLDLRGVTLSNRLAVVAAPTDSSRDGMLDEGQGAALVRHAAAGAGLVLTDLVAVAPQARITPGCPGLWSGEHAAVLGRLVEHVHARSASRIGIRVGHAGRRGATRPRTDGLDRPLRVGAWPLLAPSALRYTPTSAVPTEMTRADMGRVREEFVRAAELALAAGFDLLELDFAQGRLFSSFLSPLSNRRSDRFGGELAARAAFPLEVFDAVRAVWPTDRPVSVALSATDWVRDGIEVDDTVAVAVMLRERGCDLVHVIAGQTLPESRPRYGSYWSALFADRVRNHAGVPVAVASPNVTSDAANTLLASGRADLIIVDAPGLDAEGG
jgi:anthraniloyl-CoA monooxygenase